MGAKQQRGPLQRLHVLADVLPSKHDPAGLALEAADVPLLLQGQ